MQSTAIMDFLAPLSGDPVLQAIVAGLCTFILEDPTTLSCGLLVGSGSMNYWTALIGLSSGIALGDIGLYWLGRLLGKSVVKWKWLTREQLDHGKAWGEGNLFSTLFAARFIPGARFPTYLTAGVLRVSFLKFAVLAVLFSIAWTTLLLSVTAWLGEFVFTLLGPAKWVVALVILLIVVVYCIFRFKKIRKQIKAISAVTPSGEAPPVSQFELWHPLIFYFPVFLQYLWLSFRYGGPMTPFSANPSIYSSGICRESKSQILGLVPKSCREFMLNRAVFQKPSNPARLPLLTNHALAVAEKHGVHLPFVAKPDHGQRGDGVRLIRTKRELAKYLKQFPSTTPIIFQELAAGTSEAGVFYCRHPRELRGRIISITLKFFPHVTGDGKSTLEQLIMADARAKLLATVYLRRHRHQLTKVLQIGEEYPLVFSGNHCQGAIFRDGNHLLTPELERAMDEIAGKMPGFYFGRFDLRFKDLESLQQGKGFQIIEINGASSESTHIWDANTTLREAYNALFLQFRLLFEIGLENRRKGHHPISAFQFIRDLRTYNTTSRSYPSTS